MVRNPDQELQAVARSWNGRCRRTSFALIHDDNLEIHLLLQLPAKFI